MFLNNIARSRAVRPAAFVGLVLSCCPYLTCQTTDPFEDCKAEDRVPAELAAISSVLRVCDKVGAISRGPARAGLRAEDFAVESARNADVLHGAVEAAQRAMDRNLAKANLGVGFLSAKLSEQTARNLKWSSALIGGVGSGVGGGLRLVNDKGVTDVASMAGKGPMLRPGSYGPAPPG